MATLDELVKPLTRAEVEASIYAAIAARGGRTTGWKPGAAVRTIIVGVSIVLSSLSQLQAQLARLGFLELSEKDWLTLVAKYVYGVTRDEGSFATGTVTLDNAGGGIYSGVAGDLLFLNSTTGKTYRNTEAFSIGSLETGVVVAIQAVEIGTASNAAAGEIDDWGSSPLAGVSVSNAAAVQGTDREEDPALRARCFEKTGTLSPNGPRDAYHFVAKTTKRANGTSIGVTRARTAADGMGGVTLYVASAGGGVAPSDVALIQAAIETQVAPHCVTPVVVSASGVTQAITYELWVRDVAGLTESDVRDAVQEALEDWIAVQPIGGHRKTGETQGRIYVEAIEVVVGAVRGSETIDLVVTLPAGNVDLDIDEVLTLGAITGTVHLVAGGVLG